MSHATYCQEVDPKCHSYLVRRGAALLNSRHSRQATAQSLATLGKCLHFHKAAFLSRIKHCVGKCQKNTG